MYETEMFYRIAFITVCCKSLKSVPRLSSNQSFDRRLFQEREQAETKVNELEKHLNSSAEKHQQEKVTFDF